jgi:hypothetical protein
LNVWVLSFLSVFWLGGAWLGCVSFRVLSVGKVCGVWRCVYLRVFSPRRCAGKLHDVL